MSLMLMLLHNKNGQIDPSTGYLPVCLLFIELCYRVTMGIEYSLITFLSLK